MRKFRRVTNLVLVVLVLVGTLMSTAGATVLNDPALSNFTNSGGTGNVVTAGSFETFNLSAATGLSSIPGNWSFQVDYSESASYGFFWYDHYTGASTSYDTVSSWANTTYNGEPDTTSSLLYADGSNWVYWGAPVAYSGNNNSVPLTGTIAVSYNNGIVTTSLNGTTLSNYAVAGQLNYIMFESYPSGSITLTNFQLAYLPDPPIYLSLVLCGAGLLVRRRRRC